MTPTRGLHRATDRTRAQRPLIALGVVAALAIGLSTAAFAADQFNDVPDSHPFHDEISWMADAGISEGFPDGGYHPSDPVTRQAMSAFMQRLYNVRDDIAVDSTTGPSDEFSTTSTTFVTDADLAATVVVPPGTTATIVARYSANTFCADPEFNGYCLVRLRHNGNVMTPIDPSFTLGGEEVAFTMERYATNVGPGSHTITVQGAVENAFSLTHGEQVLIVETVLNPAP